MQCWLCFAVISSFKSGHIFPVAVKCNGCNVAIYALYSKQYMEMHTTVEFVMGFGMTGASGDRHVCRSTKGPGDDLTTENSGQDLCLW